ncbi:MAG TPA: RcpC/CpaB family pilus assembly protein [Elusimicrobiales bacterium]|nr:RcpC/CpaB family pilus assembly protein [Elusimicrobiales bacterium]
MKRLMMAAALAAVMLAPRPLGAAGAESGHGSVAQGYRGAAITVGWDQLLYVKKGDRVDVLVTFDALMKDDRKEKVTATILQNVVVLNVMKPAKREGAGVIELLLNPNEAQYAALSVAQGQKVHISVRAPGDLELHPMEMASFRRLIK